MQHIILMSCAILLSFSCFAQNEVRGTTDNAPQTVSAEQLFAEQLCKDFSSDTKKFSDCIEWENASSQADQIWADGQCRGNRSYKKDNAKFEKCAKEKQAEVRFKRTTAQDKCGGFEAYSKDTNKFRVCKDREYKKVKYPSQK